VPVTLDLGNEPSVDLNPVERKGVQVRERRIPGPEIVQRDLDAESFQTPQHRDRTGEIVD
jgi:hypothetical protein